jgi:Acetyltransferase (GNAT) domain
VRFSAPTAPHLRFGSSVHSPTLVNSSSVNLGRRNIQRPNPYNVTVIDSSSSFQVVDPIGDARWSAFVAASPRACVFHSAAWLQALRQSYGYRPVVYSSTASRAVLQDGLVLCEVRSWLTGRRMVSLPFSDHCDPLVDDPNVLGEMLSTLRAQASNMGWRYIEMRPFLSLSCGYSRFRTAEQYFHHELDLSPSLDTLFCSFHKDSTQRKIRRAEKENLSFQEGSTNSLLKAFYSLFLLTRRRHCIPPQPLRWFRNLISAFKEDLQIRVAFKADRPVAAILTLRHKGTLTYKYGCSDARMNNLGGTQMLFWRAIQDAKKRGLVQFDLGRSDITNTGLVTFKDRWGASRTEMSYLRYYPGGTSNAIDISSKNDWKLRLAKPIFARSPDAVLRTVGSLLYRHIG